MTRLAAISVTATVFFAAATSFVGQATAVDPGANPAGNWVCFATGTNEPVGLLTMTEADYAFAANGTPVSGAGSYRVDRNVITVTSGPLRDDFGQGHGHFNASASPLALSFDTAGGRGMTCNPDIDP